VINSFVSATGMVWKTAEEIKKLPVSNKLSYRRDWLEVRFFLK
jgi:hypothetical protein